MNNLLDSIKNESKVDDLIDALETPQPNNESKKEKLKKVNVSYTIDKTNDTNLKKYVLTEKLKNIEKKGEEPISASSIVNVLLTDFFKNSK